MKKLEIFDKRIIMEKNDSIHNYFAWPSVATLRDGCLAVVASGFRLGHICPFGKSVISYSYDSGRTWTEPTPVIDTILDDRDSGILTFGEKNVIVTSFNNSLDFQKKSIFDDDDTSDYVRAYIAYAEKYPEMENSQLGSEFKFSRDGGKTFEKKIYKSQVTSPHGPMVTKDGRVIYIGNVFNDYSRIESWEIDTETGNMTKLGEVPPIEGNSLPSYEPHAIELNDGSIMLVIRSEHQPENATWQNCYDLFSLYISKSSDGGKTWSNPCPIVLDEESSKEITFSNVGAPPHVMRHSSGALLLSCAARISPMGLRILKSTDEGKTWEAFLLTDDIPFTADFGYPATAELSDGSLYTVWYQHSMLDKPAVIYGAHWNFL